MASSSEDSQQQQSMIILSDEEWKAKLTAEQYRVLREKATEPAYTGHYDKHFEDGLYKCAGCGHLLYDSSSKFDSGCGWPAFSSSLDASIKRQVTKEGHHTEIICRNCGGHLGHIFPGHRFKHKDGRPIEERHCVNSISIKFEKAKEKNG